MRVDKSKNDQIHIEDSYCIIEEYQSKWGRWVPLGDKFYLKEYESGEFSACGKCWQETGKHGTYDLDYAKKYCNDLNDALGNGTIETDIAEVTQFRICLVEKVFKKKVLIANKY